VVAGQLAFDFLLVQALVFVEGEKGEEAVEVMGGKTAIDELIERLDLILVELLCPHELGYSGHYLQAQ
jgi:hypothetical protein